MTKRLTDAEREQMTIMRDGPVMWSRTHGWPAIRDGLTIAGLVRELPATLVGGELHATTEITEAGRVVRADLLAAQ